MIGVLVRLQWMQTRGRVVRSIRLLKQPKYLVGFLVGAGWMGLWVLRPLLRSKIAIGSAPGFALGTEVLPVLHRFAALVVTFAMSIPWLFPWGRLGLPFRESELTMLLQAPLTRRQVIQYGLLKSEVGVLLSGLILPLFVGLGGPASRLLMGCGTWMLFEFWHLNGKWRALFNLRQTELPVERARTRRTAVTIGLIVFYAAVALAVKPFVLQVVAALHGANFREVTANLASVTWPPLLQALLAPAWWLTGPIFSGGGAAFLVAAGPVLIAILLQREVVLRSRARFEESALERATAEEGKKSPKRRFARISSRARTRSPFGIDRPGPPEVAVVWKNAIKVSRQRWRHVAYFASAVWIAIVVLPALFRWPGMTYGVAAVFGMVSLVMPPVVTGMSWQNDFRTELTHLELVRTWPVAAPRFVLAEVLSPAILSFASSVFGGGVILASLFGSRLREAMTSQRADLVLLPKSGEILGVAAVPAALILFVSVLPMTAAVSLLSSALQNLATLFVPAWMAQAADRTRGVAAFGQRLVVSVALWLALGLALIPSALLVLASVLVQRALGIPWTAWAFPLWSVLAAAPLFAIAALMLQAAGRLWERLDPSQEILELGR